MSSYVLGAILLLACAALGYSYLRKLRRGESCCASGGEPVKKVRVADRRKENYPHKVLLTLDGMTCANCALRVENALNSLSGIWAEVDLGRKTAVVRSKEPLDLERLCQEVRNAGYLVIHTKQEEA